MRRGARWAILLVVGLAGCSATPPASLAPSIPPTVAPSPSPSVEPSPFVEPSGVDHDDCQLAIRAAHIFGDELAAFAGATGDHDAQDDIVRETVELADASRDVSVDGPTMVRWNKLLRDLHSAGLDYDNGDPLPFIDAVGKAALYEYDLRPSCA